MKYVNENNMMYLCSFIEIDLGKYIYIYIYTSEN